MDIDYLLWLQNIREALGPIGDFLFNVISFFVILGVVLAILIYWCHDKKEGSFLLLCFFIGDSLNATIKNTLCVYRPWVRDARIHVSDLSYSSAGGYSCPSGHTTNATLIYGSLAKKKWWLWILVAIIAFSRNYLGVHTPQDILLGFFEALVVITLLRKAVAWYGQKQRNDLLFVTIGLVVVTGLITYTLCKSYPMTYVDGQLLVDPIKMQAEAMMSYGFFAGGMIGLLLEKRYVGFTIDSITTKQKVIRILIGVICLGLVYGGIKFGLHSVLPSTWLKFSESFFVAITGLFVVPMLFTRIEK